MKRRSRPASRPPADGPKKGLSEAEAPAKVRKMKAEGLKILGSIQSEEPHSIEAKMS
jgi:hypothetical protein